MEAVDRSGGRRWPDHHRWGLLICICRLPGKSPPRCPLSCCLDAGAASVRSNV